MRIKIGTPSGKRFEANIGTVLDVDASQLTDEDWEWCEDHAVLYHLAVERQIVLYITEEHDLEDASQDMRSLIEASIRIGATWLLLHT